MLADHRLPGTTGVDFLCELAADPDTAYIATVLVTGQADQADTIKAVNLAGLDYYIAKPWSVAELDAVVRKLLTDVVEATGLDPMPHLAALDPVRAMDLVRRRLACPFGSSGDCVEIASRLIDPPAATHLRCAHLLPDPRWIGGSAKIS